ncbi:type II toxin-antitoxin system antitoxin SocA domain-containing protein [Pelosinus sp. IPA-1]|uniref:Panacea domain-containing protein n=1 Tax=Pelosinus sp. IPA-1 TaxID=3029569 RepID=UPI00243622D0|nr:type II toxin-antitoxin system antitoxin SocA domain-containing protein [Pelosinus sp. IPA-1]GMB02265.1 hypothetical protein PIPA1_50660 [Pelosinus sp. IPA-1]
MVEIILVIEYFLAKSIPKTQRAITNLKLQKLLYYAQGFFMASNNNDMLFRDELQAWVHGPVCHEVYTRYKEYGFNEIPKSNDEVILPEEVTKVLDRVWNVFGSYNGSQLEYLTHRESPWIKARNGLKPWEISNNPIDPEEIRHYFQSKLGGGN